MLDFSRSWNAITRYSSERNLTRIYMYLRSYLIMRSLTHINLSEDKESEDITNHPRFSSRTECILPDPLTKLLLLSQAKNLLI